MLYIVATPIGNMEDISLRALRILQEVDIAYCEDTRVTCKLFFKYGIDVPLKSLHHHSSERVLKIVAKRAASKEKVAYLSDGGTPGVSDPGALLVEETLKVNKNALIVPIPGPSAVTCIASICGFPMERFLFLGFPPKKRKRKQFFEEVLGCRYPVVFYDSPHGIMKSLGELSSVDGSRNIVVMREATKMHEIIYRGTVDSVMHDLEKENIKGEFTIVIR